MESVHDILTRCEPRCRLKLRWKLTLGVQFLESVVRLFRRFNLGANLGQRMNDLVLRHINLGIRNISRSNKLYE